MPAENLKILYEDNHLLFVNKKSGTIVHQDKTQDRSLKDMAEHFLRSKYSKTGNVFVGIPHRLDRPVSGVSLICKTGKSLTRINEMFQKKSIDKTYLCLSYSRPDVFKGTLSHFLLKDTKKNKVKAMDHQKKGGKLSVLDFELLGEINGVSLFKVVPKTGRSHQIRVQMAYMGCPIVGDIKYGASKALKDKSIALHCRKLSFIHPVKKDKISVTALLPDIKEWQLFKEIVKNI